MRRFLLCGVFLASICFAQTDSTKAVWRRLKADDGTNFAVSMPEMLVNEVASGRNVGDLLLLFNEKGQRLIADPYDKVVCEQPPGMIVGTIAATKELYYLNEGGLAKRKFGSEIDIKIAAPGPGDWGYIEANDQIYAATGKTWWKLSGSAWIASEKPTAEVGPKRKHQLFITQAPSNDSQLYRAEGLGEPIQLSFQEGSPGEIVANGVTQSYLTYKQDRLVFQSQGHWFVCQIREMSAAEVKALDDAAAKTKAVSDSKQSALAFLMLANDNDDQLPENFNKADLEKYLKNSDALRDFVYTYDGPRDLNKIAEPAKTEIGYIPGPGGRAVAYADGHVKWIPDKKP